MRRAILRGVPLDTPVVGEVMQRNFTSVDPSVGRALAALSAQGSS